MIRSSNNKCVHFLATDRVNLYTCGNYVVFKVSFRFLLVGKKRGVFVWGKCIIYSSNVQGSCVFVFVACGEQPRAVGPVSTVTAVLVMG